MNIKQAIKALEKAHPSCLRSFVSDLKKAFGIAGAVSEVKDITQAAELLGRLVMRKKYIERAENTFQQGLEYSYMPRRIDELVSLKSLCVRQIQLVEEIIMALSQKGAAHE